MNPYIMGRFLLFWYAEVFSPAGFLKRAILLTVLYLLVHLAGLREYTSVLNGTAGPGAADWSLSTFFGVTYVIVYLAFVILVPVLVLGAGILAAWRRFERAREN